LRGAVKLLLIFRRETVASLEPDDNTNRDERANRERGQEWQLIALAEFHVWRVTERLLTATRQMGAGVDETAVLVNFQMNVGPIRAAGIPG
jgi:hypothetical protein